MDYYKYYLMFTQIWSLLPWASVVLIKIHRYLIVSNWWTVNFIIRDITFFFLYHVLNHIIFDIFINTVVFFCQLQIFLSFDSRNPTGALFKLLTFLMSKQTDTNRHSCAHLAVWCLEPSSPSGTRADLGSMMRLYVSLLVPGNQGN